jgi:hypothetical protein
MDPLYSVCQSSYKAKLSAAHGGKGLPRHVVAEVGTMGPTGLTFAWSHPLPFLRRASMNASACSAASNLIVS